MNENESPEDWGNQAPSQPATIVELLAEHIPWSKATFGEEYSYRRICRHIVKELSEISAEPQKLEEWVDVMLLALDGAWRAGHSPEAIWAELCRKAAEIRTREYPRPIPGDDTPSEHIRNFDQSKQKAHAAAVDIAGSGELSDPELPAGNQVWKKLFASTMVCSMPDGTQETLVRWVVMHPTSPQVGIFACEASTMAPVAPTLTVEELAGILAQIEDIQLKRNEKFLRSERDRREAHRTRALDRLRSLQAKGG